MGSSPLARGKPAASAAGPRALGLIPARAGKTISHGTHRILRRAHPRSRGENSGGSAFRLTALGSSPLARGKRYRADTIPLDKGLIPARAGKTQVDNLAPAPYGAHPRSRGENGALGSGSETVSGSSPLARGKHVGCAFQARPARLIPARAGETFCSSWRLWLLRAHPRSRGENSLDSIASRRSVGSSPLARGKPAYTHMKHMLIGLIPARAGKTSNSSGRS